MPDVALADPETRAETNHAEEQDGEGGEDAHRRDPLDADDRGVGDVSGGEREAPRGVSLLVVVLGGLLGRCVVDLLVLGGRLPLCGGLEGAHCGDGQVGSSLPRMQKAAASSVGMLSVLFVMAAPAKE